jgi:RNA polymerase sigma-70 factor (ECF subfamily)
MVAESPEVRQLSVAEGRASSPGEAQNPVGGLDRGDWDVFYTYCDDVIRKALASRRLQAADREDCGQEVWVAILSACPSRFGEADASLSSWLATLARNKAIDTIRRVRRHRVGVLYDVEQEWGGDPASRCGADEARRLVWSALAELERQVEPRSFLVFFLRWIEGWPFREIAAALSLGEAQARLRHHRAKRRFGELLARAAGPSSGEDARRDTKSSLRR